MLSRRRKRQIRGSSNQRIVKVVKVHDGICHLRGVKIFGQKCPNSRWFHPWGVVVMPSGPFNRECRKIIIPKGLVDPNQTTVIEIPKEYRNASTILATPKDPSFASVITTVRAPSTEDLDEPPRRTLSVGYVPRSSGVAKDTDYMIKTGDPTCVECKLEMMNMSGNKGKKKNQRKVTDMRKKKGCESCSTPEQVCKPSTSKGYRDEETVMGLSAETMCPAAKCCKSTEIGAQELGGICEERKITTEGYIQTDCLTDCVTCGCSPLCIEITQSMDKRRLGNPCCMPLGDDFVVNNSSCSMILAMAPSLKSEPCCAEPECPELFCEPKMSLSTALFPRTNASLKSAEARKKSGRRLSRSQESQCSAPTTNKSTTVCRRNEEIMQGDEGDLRSVGIASDQECSDPFTLCRIRKQALLLQRRNSGSCPNPESERRKDEKKPSPCCSSPSCETQQIKRHLSPYRIPFDPKRSPDLSQCASIETKESPCCVIEGSQHKDLKPRGPSCYATTGTSRSDSRANIQDDSSACFAGTTLDAAGPPSRVEEPFFCNVPPHRIDDQKRSSTSLRTPQQKPSLSCVSQPRRSELQPNTPGFGATTRRVEILHDEPLCLPETRRSSTAQDPLSTRPGKQEEGFRTRRVVEETESPCVLPVRRQPSPCCMRTSRRKESSSCNLPARRVEVQEDPSCEKSTRRKEIQCKEPCCIASRCCSKQQRKASTDCISQARRRPESQAEEPPGLMRGRRVELEDDFCSFLKDARRSEEQKKSSSCLRGCDQPTAKSSPYCQEIFSQESYSSQEPGRPRAYSAQTPNAYSSKAYSSKGYSPQGYSPGAFSPQDFSPQAFSPRPRSPQDFSPQTRSPQAHSPQARSPQARSPQACSSQARSYQAYSPQGFSPQSFTPQSFSSRGYFSKASSPGACSPKSYSSKGYFTQAHSSQPHSRQARSSQAYSPNVHSPKAYPPQPYSLEARSSQVYSYQNRSSQAFAPQVRPSQIFSPQARPSQDFSPQVRSSQDFPQTCSSQPFSPTDSYQRICRPKSCSPLGSSQQTCRPTCSPRAGFAQAASQQTSRPQFFFPQTDSQETYRPQSFSPLADSSKSCRPRSCTPRVISPQVVSPQADPPQTYRPQSFNPQADSLESCRLPTCTPQGSSKQASWNQAVCKQADSKQADSKQTDFRQADSLQSCRLSTCSPQAVSKQTVSKQSVLEQADAPQSCRLPSCTQQTISKQPDLPQSCRLPTCTPQDVSKQAVSKQPVSKQTNPPRASQQTNPPGRNGSSSGLIPKPPEAQKNKSSGLLADDKGSTTAVNDLGFTDCPGPVESQGKESSADVQAEPQKAALACPKRTNKKAGKSYCQIFMVSSVDSQMNDSPRRMSPSPKSLDIPSPKRLDIPKPKCLDMKSRELRNPSRATDERKESCCPEIQRNDSLHRPMTQRKDISYYSGIHQEDTSYCPEIHKKDTSHCSGIHQKNTSHCPGIQKKDTSYYTETHKKDTSYCPETHKNSYGPEIQRTNSSSRPKIQKDSSCCLAVQKTDSSGGPTIQRKNSSRCPEIQGKDSSCCLEIQRTASYYSRGIQKKESPQCLSTSTRRTEFPQQAYSHRLERRDSPCCLVAGVKRAEPAGESPCCASPSKKRREIQARESPFMKRMEIQAIESSCMIRNECQEKESCRQIPEAKLISSEVKRGDILKTQIPKKDSRCSLTNTSTVEINCHESPHGPMINMRSEERRKETTCCTIAPCKRKVEVDSSCYLPQKSTQIQCAKPFGCPTPKEAEPPTKKRCCPTQKCEELQRKESLHCPSPREQQDMRRRDSSCSVTQREEVPCCVTSGFSLSRSQQNGTVLGVNRSWSQSEGPGSPCCSSAARKPPEDRLCCSPVVYRIVDVQEERNCPSPPPRRILQASRREDYRLMVSPCVSDKDGVLKAAEPCRSPRANQSGTPTQQCKPNQKDLPICRGCTPSQSPTHCLPGQCCPVIIKRPDTPTIQICMTKVQAELMVSSPTESDSLCDVVDKLDEVDEKELKTLKQDLLKYQNARRQLVMDLNNIKFHKSLSSPSPERVLEK